MTVITEELKARAEEIKNEANVCFKGKIFENLLKMYLMLIIFFT
jgi:hypothetical protein